MSKKLVYRNQYREAIGKNVKKEIESTKGEINSYYDMSIENMNQIRFENSCIFDIIVTAFRFGYLQGSKAEKKGKAFIHKK